MASNMSTDSSSVVNVPSRKRIANSSVVSTTNKRHNSESNRSVEDGDGDGDHCEKCSMMSVYKEPLDSLRVCRSCGYVASSDQISMDSQVMIGGGGTQLCLSATSRIAPTITDSGSKYTVAEMNAIAEAYSFCRFTLKMTMPLSRVVSNHLESVLRQRYSPDADHVDRETDYLSSDTVKKRLSDCVYLDLHKGVGRIDVLVALAYFVFRQNGDTQMSLHTLAAMAGRPLRQVSLRLKQVQRMLGIQLANTEPVRYVDALVIRWRSLRKVGIPTATSSIGEGVSSRRVDTDVDVNTEVQPSLKSGKKLTALMRARTAALAEMHTGDAHLSIGEVAGRTRGILAVAKACDLFIALDGMSACAAALILALTSLWRATRVPNNEWLLRRIGCDSIARNVRERIIELRHVLMVVCFALPWGADITPDNLLLHIDIILEDPILYSQAALCKEDTFTPEQIAHIKEHSGVSAPEYWPGPFIFPDLLEPSPTPPSSGCGALLPPVLLRGDGFGQFSTRSFAKLKSTKGMEALRLAERVSRAVQRLQEARNILDNGGPDWLMNQDVERNSPSAGSARLKRRRNTKTTIERAMEPESQIPGSKGKKRGALDAIDLAVERLLLGGVSPVDITSGRYRAHLESVSRGDYDNNENVKRSSSDDVDQQRHMRRDLDEEELNDDDLPDDEMHNFIRSEDEVNAISTFTVT